MSFRSKVENAISEAKKVLGNARNPVIPANISHTYEDKYFLAEISTRVAITAIRNSLDHATNGSFSKCLPQMLHWYRAKKTVIMRTQAEERCVFTQTTVTDVKSNTSQMSATTSSLFGTSISQSFTITKVTEHEWHYQVDWETFVYPGDEGIESSSKTSLAASCTSASLLTRSDKPVTPRPLHRSAIVEEVDLTWLLKAFGGDSAATDADAHVVVDFSIDRSDEKTCHTPRRNAQVEQAMNFFQRLHFYQAEVQHYLRHMDAIAEMKERPAGTSAAISDACEQLFDPIPAAFVLEEKQDGNEKGTTLQPADLDAILKQQSSVLSDVLSRLMESIPPATSMFNDESVRMILGYHLVGAHAKSYSEQIQELENMLMHQLVGAIGKVVQPHHFAEYMDYHHRQLFSAAHAPRGFCQAVRRVDHCPEGTIALEQQNEKGDYQPVPCFVAGRSSTTDGAGAAPITFPLNASANLTFFGDQYLHSFVLHQFSGVNPAPIRLAARARQFSSFVLMIGSMSGPSSFETQNAIIIKNKDDLLIPLLLETIPTPKQFKDAIESLSPEQQRFAKQFRAMQLNATLFAIVTIQIKPQLERVLNLPPDALTKEIKLTQSLMELFIEYQIPSDLLSFSATEDLGKPPTAAVKEHVQEIEAMLGQSKGRELNDAFQQRMKDELRGELEDSGCAYSTLSDLSRSSRGGVTFGAPPPMPMLSSACPPLAPTASFGGGGSRSQPQQPKSKVMKKMAVRREEVAVASTTASTLHATPSAGASADPPSNSDNAAQGQNYGSSSSAGVGVGAGGESAATVDWTNIPKRMDESFEKLDTDSALRPTILKTSETWQRTTQNGLLSKPAVEYCFSLDDQRIERNRAFDLLDALTRSGAMSVETDSALHVVLCATHCFERSVMDTLVRDNMNPIEKAERSSLIMASTIHRLPAVAMIQAERLGEVSKWSPGLFVTNGARVIQNTEAKE